jgi:hypothetical protein
MYVIAFCWVSIDIPEPTIVWGLGTGRSGIGTVVAVFAPASRPSPLGLVLATVLALALEAADPAPLGPPASCLLSQAPEASKISGATQANQRMRVE